MSPGARQIKAVFFTRSHIITSQPCLKMMSTPDDFFLSIGKLAIFGPGGHNFDMKIVSFFFN